jgi:D-arabinose 1-dehydrogenase-like Zn-dependent alcohol dehydrogenase
MSYSSISRNILSTGLLRSRTFRSSIAASHVTKAKMNSVLTFPRGKKLKNLLPKDRPYLDAVIDGAGGDVVNQSMRLLKVSELILTLWSVAEHVQAGGVISSYGMTLGPQMPFLMGAVLKNIELRGSTMGSRKEFKDMIDLVKTKNIKPVVSRVVQGLDIAQIDTLFDDMKRGSQFGKLVVDLSSGGSSRL